MVDRSKIKSPVQPVDVTDELGSHALQLGALGKRRRRDLDEDDLPSPLGVDLEKLLERLELVIHALCDVELLPTDDDLLVLVEHAERIHLGLDGWSVAVVRDTLDVDTDRAVADSGDRAVGVDAAGGRFVAADANAGGDKVSGVGVCLEGNDVGAEHAVEDLLAGCDVSGNGGETREPTQSKKDPREDSLGRHRKISELGQGVCMNIPIMISPVSLCSPPLPSR